MLQRSPSKEFLHLVGGVEVRGVYAEGGKELLCFLADGRLERLIISAPFPAGSDLEGEESLVYFVESRICSICLRGGSLALVLGLLFLLLALLGGFRGCCQFNDRSHYRLALLLFVFLIFIVVVVVVVVVAAAISVP